jgi:ribosomal protein S18 acetylase RimI-like enzyme
LEIRPLRPADAPAIQKDCFPELPLEDVEERVEEDLALQDKGEGITLVAEEGARIGVHAKLLKRNQAGWIFNVASHPDFRGRGILQRLFGELETRARDMGITRLAIHVRADNVRARRAYEKAGFRHVGQDGMRGDQLRYEKKVAP